MNEKEAGFWTYFKRLHLDLIIGYTGVPESNFIKICTVDMRHKFYYINLDKISRSPKLQKKVSTFFVSCSNQTAFVAKNKLR